MEFLSNIFHQMFAVAGPFFVLLGLLIFVHELGHFLVAKWCGVRVEVFSLGFGKKIAQYVHGDTTYCISIIPLGGYVKMYGDDPTAEVPEDQQKFAFLKKPVSQRIAIVLAGPLMNFFFAAVLFALIALIGQMVPDTTIGDIKPSSSAFLAGFRSGDKITKVNGREVQVWSELDNIISENPNRQLNFEVLRGSSKTPTAISATPSLSDNPNILSSKDKVGQIEGLSIFSKAPIVGVSSPSSPAGMAGIKNIVFIRSIGGTKVEHFRQIPTLFKENSASSLPVEVEYSDYAFEDRDPEKLEVKKAAIDLSSISDANKILESLGFGDPELFLLEVKEDSPAAVAGLQPGDKMVEVNGKPLDSWEQLLTSVKSYKENSGPIKFTIERAGKELPFSITPKMTSLVNSKGQDDKRFTIGIIPAITSVAGTYTEFKISNPFIASVHGFKKAIEWSATVAISFVRIFEGSVSSKNIGGIITIGKVASDSFKAGIDKYLMMMAIISINLFLLNLLPVPILDGGHLVFFTLEALRGAPMSLKKMEIAQQIGLFLLISLMLFSIFNDISNLFFSPW